MDRRFVRIMAWMAATAMVMGCATGISKEVRSQVTFTGSFSELQQNPEQYKGQTVIFGGRIIESQILEQGPEFMVLQLELDDGDRPLEDDQSKGRFLVHSKQFLDPAIYPQGTLVTVAGTLAESQARLIGQMTYRYPVIVVLEIKKWPPAADNAPRIHFGIGVGTVF
ncbi:MAG: Slp family lipoprotein [Desulfatitalea sp.]|nr:Slp family lipoprotein [Desulfatitalea sp.]MBI5897295.1 Slp family lipoprotein [Desulfobacterales bacterium]